MTISIFPDWENGLAWDALLLVLPTENAIYLIDDAQMAAAPMAEAEALMKKKKVVAIVFRMVLGLHSVQTRLQLSKPSKVHFPQYRTTDGAADGNFVVEYTKTPDSKNYKVGGDCW